VAVELESWRRLRPCIPNLCGSAGAAEQHADRNGPCKHSEPDGDGNTEPKSERNAPRNANGDAHPNGDRDGYKHGNGDAHRNGDRDSNEHGHGDRYPNQHGYRDSDANTD
jgi:hypothetical protein